jgi:non-ribosomal peptide synthetase component F
MTRQASEVEFEIISSFNRTEAPFPDHATLTELIETQVAKTPDAEAVICDHDKSFGVTSLTFSQLNQRANLLAHLLRARGVKRGDVVGLLTERSFAMIVGVLGILKSGAAYLPLSPENPPDRI